MNINEDYQWFKENRDLIIQGHEGSSVVIKNKHVIAYFDNDQDALNSMLNEQSGSYIIQKCIPQEDSDMFYYTGRYSF